MSSITINEIEILFKLIIDKLEKDHLQYFNFSTDEYWLISADKWNDFKNPPEIVVGSLKDDINYLKKSIVEKEVFTYSDLDRLATVLRAISEQQAPS